MIRYTLINGITIYASGAHDFVRKLRIASHYTNITDATFMALFSEKMETANGCHIRTDNAGEFAADILAYGYATAATLSHVRSW